MRHPLLRCVAGLLAFVPSIVSFGGATFFVSPGGGTDSGPGTAELPFRTVARARDAVRAERSRPGQIVVTLRGGNHFLTEPLVLTPEDSGSADRPIIYAAAPGEMPVLSGGEPGTAPAKA